MSQERHVYVMNGWGMLPLTIALCVGGIAMFGWFGLAGKPCGRAAVAEFGIWSTVIGGLLLFGLGMFSCFGVFHAAAQRGPRADPVRRVSRHGAHGRLALDQPAEHQAADLASRRGTSKGERLKVNDKRGNPIEIAAVVVWRVQDTAQAVFDVEHYERYVRDPERVGRAAPGELLCLRSRRGRTRRRCGAAWTKSRWRLQEELQERVAKAGVVVEEARLTHLAYAPEIAGVMLRRQQAEAIIDARQKIVHGAVSMVQMALEGPDREQGHRARRGAQGHDGQQSAGRALRRARGAAGDQRRHAVHVSLGHDSIMLRGSGPGHETAQSLSCSASAPSSTRPWKPGPSRSSAASTGRSSTCSRRPCGEGGGLPMPMRRSPPPASARGGLLPSVSNSLWAARHAPGGFAKRHFLPRRNVRSFSAAKLHGRRRLRLPLAASGVWFS